MRLIYLANIRLPTEKAHGLQIMQNCEALAQAGANVSLWAARRFNATEFSGVDPFLYYAVKPLFNIRRLPSIDLLPLVPGRSDFIAKLVFGLQLFTYLVSAFLGSMFSRADIYYSRVDIVLLALSLIKKRHQLAYEVHTLAPGRLGSRLQHYALKRVGHVFTTTARLREDIIAKGVSSDLIHVAHDGIRAGRFEGLPSREQARQRLGWPQDAFIVGYVGRLQTMDMDKGVGQLVEALGGLADAAFGLVGGPDDHAERLRQQWTALGNSPDRFLYAGHVVPDKVPLYLSAFDVCAMPFPWTTHFAYYASPIKLFEYMAAGKAVVASALPSTMEIVQDGKTALLYPPGDSQALRRQLETLRDNAALREQLGETARAHVLTHYTWEARARAILSALRKP